MGRAWIDASELPRTLKCPECGSGHVKIYGTRTMEYEREEINGEKVSETHVSVLEETVEGVECLECGAYADPDNVTEWDAEGETEDE
jgi:transcription elongation factor Elf1